MRAAVFRGAFTIQVESDEPDRSLTCSVSSTYSLVSVFLRSEGERLSFISTGDE